MGASLPCGLMPLPAARHPPAAPSPPRSLTAAVRAVQIAYPQIYLACHTRHTRARSSAFRLSARDSSLLVHLDETHPTRPAALARHMGVGASTMSAALRAARVARLHHPHDAGYGSTRRRAATHREGSRGAERDVGPRSRAGRGAAAHVDPADRTRAVDGLTLLGRASATRPSQDGDDDRARRPDRARDAGRVRGRRRRRRR